MYAQTSAKTVREPADRAALDLGQSIRWIGKPIVFVLASLPLLVATGRVFDLFGGLGANPIEALLDHFGQWALRFVLITLAITPLRRLTGLAWLARFRRMLGLFAFVYAALHFLVYLVLDQGLALGPVLEDIVERPFITLGMAALLILCTLALTSTLSARRRLGRRWQTLHNGVYVAGILVVWHFWWQVKKDISEPLVYAAILAALLGVRLWWRRRGARS